jgi:hypothetical protein
VERVRVKSIDQHSATDTSLRKVLLCSLALCLIFSALYFPSIHFGFINLDDYTILLSNPDLYNEQSLCASLKAIFFERFPREEPLLVRDLSWVLNSYLFGFKNPVGYHLGNVALHSINVSLLFIFLLLNTKRFYLSLALAITFGVLPAHVEPVCWVMGRKDVLVSFFMLLTLVLQTLYLRPPHSERRGLLYLLTILTTLAALLSKISAFTFFLVLAAHQLFAHYLHEPQPPDETSALRPPLRQVLGRVAPHFLITFVILLWYRNIVSQWGVLDRGVDSLSLDHIAHLVTFIPLVLALYLKLIFFPFQHSIAYDWPTIHQPLTQVQILLSVAILVTIVCVSVFLFKQRKQLFFYLTVFFLLMIPYFNFQYIGIWVANRYAYLSSFALLGLFMTPLADWARRRTPPVRAALILLWVGYVALNATQCVSYQSAWKDNPSLWKYETNLKNPPLISFASLADAYLRAAEETPDPNARAALYRESEKALQDGIDRFQRSGIRSTTPQLFKYYYVWTLLAEARGESLQKQLSYAEQAYRLSPKKPLVLRKMAAIYFGMATRAAHPAEQERLAAQSLEYFEKYLRVLDKDPALVKQNMLILDQEYGKKFPFLKDKIAVAAQVLYDRIRQ